MSELRITSRIPSASMPSIREPFLDMMPLMVVEDVKNAPHASRVIILEMNLRAFIPRMILHQQKTEITS